MLKRKFAFFKVLGQPGDRERPEMRPQGYFSTPQSHLARLPKAAWYLLSVDDFLSQASEDLEVSVPQPTQEHGMVPHVEDDVVISASPTVNRGEEENADFTAAKVEAKEEVKEDRVARHLRKISSRRLRRDQLEAELALVDKDVASLKLELGKQEQMMQIAKTLVTSREKELVLAKERLLHALLSSNAVLNQVALEEDKKQLEPQPQLPLSPPNRVSFAVSSNNATPLPLSTSHSNKPKKLYHEKVAQIVDLEERMSHAWIRARRGLESLAKRKQKVTATASLDQPQRSTGLPAGLVPVSPSPSSMAAPTSRRRRSPLTRPPPPPPSPPSPSRELPPRTQGDPAQVHSVRLRTPPPPPSLPPKQSQSSSPFL